MKRLFFLFLCLSVLGSCKKETKKNIDDSGTVLTKTFDTICPLSYFPVYPGSYWKYIYSYSVTIPYSNPLAYNTGTNIITCTTSANYQKDAYFIPNYPSNLDFHSDTCLVPFYNNIPVWANKMNLSSINHYTKTGESPLKLVVTDSLQVGDSWFEYNEFYGYTKLSIRTKDTSIVLNGTNYSPVIIVRSKKDEKVGGNGPYWGITDLYYAKNIGLIRTKTVYTSNEQLYPLKEGYLLDYHINK